MGLPKKKVDEIMERQKVLIAEEELRIKEEEKVLQKELADEAVAAAEGRGNGGTGGVA